LEPSASHRQATALITQILAKHHYKKTKLNNEISEVVLQNYLDSLDPSRSYFWRRDIDHFDAYRHRLDDALRASDLAPAFHIFGVFRRRLDDRMRYAQTLLTGTFDFTRDEAYQVDRSEASWASDQQEWDDIWRRRVKNDVLTLRLEGKSEEDIRQTLHKRYDSLLRRVGQLNADDVYQLFVNAYTSGIDPHTAYFSPRMSDNVAISLSLSLEGIGAALQSEHEHTVVRRIIPGGPADKSQQLRVGDRITAVGQGQAGEMVDVVGWRLEDVVDLIRGPKGSMVRLHLLPKDHGPGGPKTQLSLVRNRIELEEQAAKKAIFEAGVGEKSARIGILTIPAFYLDIEAARRGDRTYRSTARDARRLIQSMVDDGIDGLIVDLRGNSGGALTQATELTGLFIRKGPVVQLRDASGRIEVTPDPDPGVAYEGPLAVLVDGGSASASEIFAGAIQDYGRGIIIGEPTFGKGTVQQLISLDRLAQDVEGRLGQLKLTVAQFFRVSGSSTQHRGVIPDITFPLGSASSAERQLPNALPWAAVSAADYLPWSNLATELLQVRDSHERRSAKNAALRARLAEITSEREERRVRQVSLLESKRRAEWTASTLGDEESSPPVDAAGAGGSRVTAASEDAEDDPVLGEAAHILVDFIASTAPPSRTIGVATKASWGSCQPDGNGQSIC
jgi:carboxyl-terminal processing protease